MLAQPISPAAHGDEANASNSAAVQLPAQCWSTNNESFDAQSLSGLVIVNDWLRAGDIVYVADAVVTPLSQLIDADDIIDMLRDRASDVAGEGADGYPGVTDDQKKILEAAVHGWIALCCPPTFWGVENVRKHVLTDAELDAAARTVIGGES